MIITKDLTTSRDLSEISEELMRQHGSITYLKMLNNYRLSEKQKEVLVTSRRLVLDAQSLIKDLMKGYYDDKEEGLETRD